MEQNINDKEKNAIEIKNLNFSYDKIKIIDSFSMTVKDGEFIALLGPNGVGKSTLFNIISGILPFTEGSVTIFGKNINKMKYKERANLIAVVPQETSSNFNFKNIDIVLMSRACKKSQFANEDMQDYDIALNAMKLTKTEDIAYRGYMEISGGEKQRVIIAQAIAQDTKILLLDEPTSNLDINFQIEIMQLILQISKKQHLTVVGVFHDINLAAQYADRIILIKNGKIFADGTPADILNCKNIFDVYGAHVIVGKNPFTNKVFITPHYNSHYDLTSIPEKRKKIHIIAGGGSGSYLFNILQSEGHIITTCILSSIDTDAKVAKQLGIRLVLEDPHITLREENIRLNEDLISECDVVIVARVDFGEENYCNLESVKKALELNKCVYFIDGKNFFQRDFTNGRATAFFKKLLAMGARDAGSEEELAILLNK
jgi:iron complex transport system ATP-binding protein